MKSEEAPIGLPSRGKMGDTREGSLSFESSQTRLGLLNRVSISLMFCEQKVGD